MCEVIINAQRRNKEGAWYESLLQRTVDLSWGLVRYAYYIASAQQAAQEYHF